MNQLQSVNQARLVGWLASRPDFRSMPSGDPVATFRVKTCRENHQGSIRDTYHSVVAFGQDLVDSIKGIQEGGTIEVRGFLKQRKYQDRWITEIEALKIFAAPKVA